MSPVLCLCLYVLRDAMVIERVVYVFIDYRCSFSNSSIRDVRHVRYAALAPGQSLDDASSTLYDVAPWTITLTSNDGSSNAVHDVFATIRAVN